MRRRAIRACRAASLSCRANFAESFMRSTVRKETARNQQSCTATRANRGPHPGGGVTPPRNSANASDAGAFALGCGCCEGWTPTVASLLSTVEARSRVMDRRQALRAFAATISLATGCGTVTSTQRPEAAELARESISVDLHSHAGILRSSTTSLDGQLQRMARGTLKASLLCAVADGPVLGLR